jgi:N4-gp56 family major capsid protein
MADTNTTTAINDNLMASFFSQKMIARLEPNTPLIEFAVKDEVPLRTGKTATFNGWNTLAAASVALAEGTPNSLPALSSRRVVATIAGYGRGVKLTDLFQMTSFFDAVNGAMDVLQDSARKTVEAMCQMGIYKNSISKNSVKTSNLSAFMSSTASAFLATTAATHSPVDLPFGFPPVLATSCARLSAVGKGAPSISAQLSVYSVRKAVTSLRAVDAQPFADGYFVGYGHPNALHCLRKDPTWANWNQYQNSKETMYKGEVGRVEKVRFIDSTMAFRYAVAAHSVCGVFIFGQGAFGFTSLDGMVKMMIARGPDKYDTWDQFTPVTYKIYGAAVPLNLSAGRILWVHEKL